MKYELREVTVFDALTLYRWRNDPLVLEQSGNTKPVTWYEHFEWLDKVLKSPDYKLWIFEVDNNPVGQIRFSREDNLAVLSYSISLFPRGRGYGVDMVRMGTRLVLQEWSEVHTLWANVKWTNIASLKTLQSAGWQLDIYEKRTESASLYYYRKAK